MITGIIPARYESTRFPGKPLIDIHGKSMLQRVYEQCLKSKLDRLVVATDDERIVAHVQAFAGEVIITDSTHKSGTDRIAEAANQLDLQDDGIVVNIQCDEPFIHPEDINLLTACFENLTTQIATLVKKIDALETLENLNNPKVVLNSNKEALYFSRAPIPNLKDFFDLVILGVALCASISIPFFWIKYSLKKQINKLISWIIFFLLFFLLAWILNKIYS